MCKTIWCKIATERLTTRSILPRVCEVVDQKRVLSKRHTNDMKRCCLGGIAPLPKAVIMRSFALQL